MSEFKNGDLVYYIGSDKNLTGLACVFRYERLDGKYSIKVGTNGPIMSVDPSDITRHDPPENLGTESSKTSESGLVDSGQRVAFGTGAVREASGKGRCDLLPWDIVGKLVGSAVTVEPFCRYMDDATRHHDLVFSISQCLSCFIGRAFDGSAPTAILEAAHQFEAGAIKYKNGRNWEAGIPLDCYLSSAGRHYLKWLRGDKDEPHDRAVVWNLLCALWTVKHKPEMIDAEVPK